MPQANTFNVSMPEQIMNSYNTMNPTKCSQTFERLNCSTILKPKPTPNLRTSPLFRKPLPPRTSSTRETPETPRTTAPSRTSSSPRTPPGFPPAPMPPSQPTDDDPKGVTKDEFKQLMSEHFKLMNLDTASIITNALKPIERAFDEADRMLDKHLAKQKNLDQTPCH